jgi:hypothetical protein
MPCAPNAVVNPAANNGARCHRPITGETGFDALGGGVEVIAP